MKRLFSTALLCLICISSFSVEREWKSWWISAPEVLYHPNMWMGFYKSVSLDSVPDALPARIAADSRYWLWINGQMVVREGGLKRGPNRSDSYYDIVDIAPYLKSGSNDIAVLLWHFGRDGFSHNSSGKPAILFDAQCESVEILSDGSWTAAVMDEFSDVSFPHVNFRLAESDIRYDATKADFQWIKGPGKSFKGAMALGFAGQTPWGALHRNPLPQWKDWGVKEYVSSELHANRRTGCDTLVCTLPHDGLVYPILKYDDVKAGTTVTILTDSYLHFCKNNARVPVHAEYVCCDGPQDFECWDWMSGHKVMYIIPAGSPVPSVSYRETGYNADFAGTFTSSDPFLNGYWQKAQRTLYVNMFDTFYDCPDRERSQWTGDAVNECEQTFYMLSREADALGGKWLRELCAWQKPNGQIYAPVPSGNWTRELSGQSLSSVGYYGLWTYYMQSGDIDILSRTYDAVEKYLNLWESRSDGTVEYRHGEWEWGDWGKNIDQEALIGALYYHALKGHYMAAVELGKDADAARIKSRMESYRSGYNARYWNGTAYRSARYRGETDDRVQACAAVIGLAREEYYPAICNVLRTEFHASPYMERYVFQAFCEMGYGEYGIERLKKRFGSIVADKEYSTLPEYWSYEGKGTVNHAWSGGAVIPIANYIIGLKPLEPGYSRFCIDLHPCGINEASLDVTTKYGPVHIHYVIKSGRLYLDFTTPEGTVCETYVNGKAVWEGGEHKLKVLISKQRPA